MCELMRALIAGGIIEGVKLDNLTPQVVDSLDCPGEDSQSQICAVSGGAATQSYAWYILLEGKSIMADSFPRWEMDPKSKEKLNLLKST